MINISATYLISGDVLTYGTVLAVVWTDSMGIIRATGTDGSTHAWHANATVTVERAPALTLTPASSWWL